MVRRHLGRRTAYLGRLVARLPAEGPKFGHSQARGTGCRKVLTVGKAIPRRDMLDEADAPTGRGEDSSSRCMNGSESTT